MSQVERSAPQFDPLPCAGQGPLERPDLAVVAAGSGRMGRGMAVAFAYAGVKVTLLDLKARDAQGVEAQCRQALAEIDEHLGSLHRAGLIGGSDIDRIAGRIRFCARDDAASALAGAGLVFEGVPERIEDKRAAFALIESLCPPECIIASTTSSMLAPELAALCQRPERFLNAHWLNPAYLIPIVELSPHAGTAASALLLTRRMLEGIGKVPVECAPSPGYIVPRLQALVMNEAARMVEEGVASAADIDRAVKLGFGLRYASMGLLEFIDYGGLDILYYAGRYMAGTVSRERYATPPIVERLMTEGDVGLRSGQGFYDWRAIDASAYRDRLLSRFATQLRSEGLLRPPASD